jgi:hypothetical protein
MFVKKIYKMQHLEDSVSPVLYIGRTVLNGQINTKTAKTQTKRENILCVYNV